jgi:DNA-binding MarR family transcriptional regulator
VVAIMVERLYPYMILLPTDRKQRVLGAIFGSNVPTDILKVSINQGISEKIYQRDLIKRFDYSNKTVIKHLKKLTELGILAEEAERIESGGRVVWVKYYLLTDLGKWFALLLTKEDTLSRDEQVEIICSAFQYYARWMKELSEKLGVKKEVLRDIFIKEIE